MRALMHAQPLTARARATKVTFLEQYVFGLTVAILAILMAIMIICKCRWVSYIINIS